MNDPSRYFINLEFSKTISSLVKYIQNVILYPPPADDQVSIEHHSTETLLKTVHMIR